MKELDVVALMEDVPEYNLQRGQVGAIIEVLDAESGVYEVEFVTQDGQTYAQMPLRAKQLMLLRYEPMA